MYVVIFCSLIALILTFLESQRALKNGMKWGFIIVTILGMIHYNYGNDYMSYLDVYKHVTQYGFDLKGILNGDYYREPGWALLCWFFKPIGGFFMMVATLNLIQNIIIYDFIKNYVLKSWWPIAVFIYLFSTSLYLMSFSMMRQEFALIVFLGMWRFIEKRKFLIPLIGFWLLSFIHSSAIVLLPFSFWGFLPIKNGKLIGAIYALILLIIWFLQNILNDIFSYALTLDESFSEYAETYGTNKTGINLGLGFAINMIPFILSILLLINKNNEYSISQKLLVSLGTITYLITPFSQIIPTVGRLGMYFSVYTIGSFPLIYSNIKNPVIRHLLLGICLFMIFYDYLIFFRNPTWVDHFTEFHTIFSQI